MQHGVDGHFIVQEFAVSDDDGRFCLDSRLFLYYTNCDGAVYKPAAWYRYIEIAHIG